MRATRNKLAAGCMVLALAGVACADSQDVGTSTTDTTVPIVYRTDTTGIPASAPTPVASTRANNQVIPDFNGDGAVRIAVVTEGARDDGSYYQALVNQVESISERSGYEAPLIVDLVNPADARTELENVVAQGADVIAIGSSNLADGNEDLFLEHEQIFWYCNCGSGYQDTPGLLRSTDSGAELGISAGFATGLLLQQRGGNRAVFLGCCDLNFEVESFLAFRFGLALVDESFDAVYAPTGNFPFDFNNTAGATEAYNAAVAEGMAAVYPFLGGAHVPIARLANDDGLVVMTAGSSRGCEREDVAYDIEVRYDAGDYLVPIFDEILSGTAEEGGARKFTVGVDPQVGARICTPTPEQEQALADLNARIGSGEFDDSISEILFEAYGF